MFMIRELQQTFSVDSTTIITSNNVMNLSEIPFPAVTIMNTFMVDPYSKEHLEKDVNEDAAQL